MCNNAHFNTVFCSIAGEAVARNFIFVLEGSRYLKFCFFDLIAGSHEGFYFRLNTQAFDFVCDDLSTAFFSLECGKAFEIELFQERIHSFSAEFHFDIPFKLVVFRAAKNIL